MQYPPYNNNPQLNAGSGQPQQFPPNQMFQPPFNQGQYLRRNKVNGVQLLISLIGLGVCIFSFYSLFHYWYPGLLKSPTPTDTLNSFCSSLKTHDYQTAYSEFSNPNGQFNNETEFASAYTYSDTAFGGITDCTVLNVNENDSSGIANGSVWLNYADGNTITLNAKLVNGSGNWRITSIK